jgi:hypothetical protein
LLNQPLTVDANSLLPKVGGKEQFIEAIMGLLVSIVANYSRDESASAL